MSDAVLFNGQAPGAAALPALLESRALHYGDGVFRTMLVWDAQVMDLDRHLAKLAADAQTLGLDPTDAGLLGDEAQRLAQGQSRAVLKLLLFRRAAERGYRAKTQATERLLLRTAAPVHPDSCWTKGIEVRRAALTLASQPALAGIKHLNRLEQVLASRDWPAGCDELLCGDAHGCVVGGTRTNLFWARAGRLYTPALVRAGVEGVMRNKIMQLAATLQVQIESRDCPWNELAQAEEMFVTNALIGLWPVRTCDGRELQAPGPLTARLAAALAHPRLS